MPIWHICPIGFWCQILIETSGVRRYGWNRPGHRSECICSMKTNNYNKARIVFRLCARWNQQKTMRENPLTINPPKNKWEAQASFHNAELDVTRQWIGRVLERLIRHIPAHIRHIERLRFVYSSHPRSWQQVWLKHNPISKPTRIIIKKSTVIPTIIGPTWIRKLSFFRV